MTDIRVGGVARESLQTGGGSLKVGGLARETLMTPTGGSLNVGGISREVLRSSTTDTRSVQVRGLVREVLMAGVSAAVINLRRQPMIGTF